MSRKMMVAVMAGIISLLADHAASARGGGAHGGFHGGFHAMPGAAVGATAPFGTVGRSNIGAAGTSIGNAGRMVGPNLGSILLSNGVGRLTAPTIPSNVGASPAGVRGAPPGPAFGGGLNNPGINPNNNPGINPYGTGMSGTAASSPLAGTNSSGTALSSGLPTNVGTVGSDHPATRQSADKAKNSQTNQDAAIDSEAAKFDRVVKGICTGC
jgi:hypothetical protein